MTDELSRPAHTTPAKVKTDSTAPLIDPAAEATVEEGTGVHDRTSSPPPTEPTPPGTHDPRRL